MRQALPLLLLAASTAQAQELTPEVHARLFQPTERVELSGRTVRVQMRGTDHQGNSKCPYFQVYVNGQGPFTFLFDTGAAYSVVSSKVVEAARARTIVHRTRRDVVSIDRLQLGGVTLRDLWAIEDDDWGVDGIIGFPTLGNVNFLFDLPRRQLLVSKKRIPMGRAFALPYEAPFNVPTVPVQIGGRTVPLLLDTGDDAYGLEVRSSELGNAALEGALVDGKSVFNGTTRQTSRTGVLKDPVKLGPVVALHADFAVNDDLPVADFGVDALNQFRLQIEPAHHRIEFEPLFHGNQFSTKVAPPKP
jgi:hypothetical protein